eukprot:gene2818-5607_t
MAWWSLREIGEIAGGEWERQKALLLRPPPPPRALSAAPISVPPPRGVGYRLIDTAALYKNEADVAAALAGAGAGGEGVFVTTKVPPDMLSAAGVEESLRRSAAALRLREEGQVRHLEELRRATGEAPEVNQLEVHPYRQRRDLVRYCFSHGIAVTARTVWVPREQWENPKLTLEAAVGNLLPLVQPGLDKK